MKVKYITTTNKHFFDVSLPLDKGVALQYIVYSDLRPRSS